MKRAVQVSVACWLLVSASGCSIVGPSCLSQQKTGAVATVSGQVASGQVMSHQVPYGTEGSQNNISISWPGQHASDGPRIRVWATQVDCVDFTPPDDPRASLPAVGACADVGGPGLGLSPTARPCAVNQTCDPAFSDLVQASLTVTNGRGNPDKLGPNPQDKLWVMGDPGQKRYIFAQHHLVPWARLLTSRVSGRPHATARVGTCHLAGVRSPANEQSNHLARALRRVSARELLILGSNPSSPNTTRRSRRCPQGPTGPSRRMLRRRC